MLYTAHGDFWKKNGLHEGWNDMNLPVNNQSDFPRLQEGGFKAIFAACCAIATDDEGNIVPVKDHLYETIRHLNLYHRLVHQRPEQVRFILKKEDLDGISEHPMNFLLAIEGADCIDDDLEVVDLFYNMGVRSVGLTWSYNNRIAGGCNEDGELSETGKKAIKRMEEYGMVLDLAHINEKSYYQCLEISTKPVIVSHTACRACYDCPRNISDDQMRAVAKTGGTIGIFGVPKYMGEPTVEKIIEHIQHTIDVVGIDHVSLGTDFGSMTAKKLIPGFEDVTDMPKFLEKLKASGLSDEDMEKITHKNIERVMREVLPSV